MGRAGRREGIAGNFIAGNRSKPGGTRMSKLLIVESPAKAKTIGKYLGPDYVVKASMGHLRDLPRKTMGVDLEGDFTPQYEPIDGKDKIIED